MRIAVLGPLEVTSDDGQMVTVPGARERLLLAVLAAGSPDVVSTDRIVETLWNGNHPANARKSLQVHLVHLRSALEPERARGEADRYVVRRGSGYALTASVDHVDALRVGEMAARARGRLAAGDPGEAVELVSAALALWRGEPYGDWPDASFADAERRRLTEVRTGAVTTLMEARLALGEDAEVVAEAERVLTDDPLHEEWWRLLVLALYRSGRQGDAMAALARARAVLVAELGAEPGPRLRAVEAALLAQDPALDLPRPRPPPDVAVCPYKGLATYEAADAALFHGRDRAVAQLVGRLVDAPLVVVSGASGAGKSSLVRAGLVPALAAGALPGSEHWRAVVVTPGRRPLDALAELAGGRAAASPVLLVCDQFEELWAPGATEAERTAFLDSVLGLLDDGVVVRCIAVVRGDHVGRLAEHPGFVERLGSTLVLVPPLTDGELREVVQGPAVAVGLTADPELVDTVLSDIGGRRAALPLLSTALVGTWERRRGNRLALAGYLEAGGVSGALARSAESAFMGLDEDGREKARRLFLRLADADDGGSLVRRPLPLTELDLDDTARRAAVDVFVSRRLLSVDGEELDVVHEALLTAWPRLARWLEDDAAGRAVRRNLVPAAREWERGGRPEDELYRGARLGAALDWAAGADGDVTPVEQRFLSASKDRSDAELTDARDRLDREVTARRRTRRLAAGLAMVLVVALVATVLAVAAQRSAERASLVADANRLAALSSTVGSLDVSHLLAAQAFRFAHTPQTQDGLLAALAGHRRAVRGASMPEILVRAKLADGGRTLFGVGLGNIQSWPVAAGGLPRVVRTTGEDWATWRAFDASPTDDLLALAGSGEAGPWVRLIDAEGAVRTVLSGNALGGEPFGISFTTDGRMLDAFVAESADGGTRSTWRLVRIDPAEGTQYGTGITGVLPAAAGDLDAEVSDDGSTALLLSWGAPVPLTLVDLVTGEQATLSLPARDVTLHDRRALPGGAALLWADGEVTLHDLTGRTVQSLDAHRSLVNDIALAPNGTWGVTVGDGGTVILWDVDPTGLWSQRESLTGHGGYIGGVAIGADGTSLVTLSSDGTVVIWDVGPDGGFGTSYPGIPDLWLAGRPEVIEAGSLVMAPTRPLGPEGPGSLGVTATFFDPRTGVVVDQVMVGDTLEDAVTGAAASVSPDRRWVAVTSGWATTVLDTRTRDVVERIVLPAQGSTDAEGRPLDAAPVWSAAWTSEGSRLVLGTEHRVAGVTTDGALAVVDTATWAVVDRVGVGVVAEAMLLSPDDRSLVLASANSEEIVVLDSESLEERRTVRLRAADRVWALSFSTDGRLLAAGGELGTLHIFDTSTWEAREPVRLGDASLLQIEWLRDDRTAVATSEDGTITLFDAQRGFARAAPLPASVDIGPARTYVVPDPGPELVAVTDRGTALRYPVNPEDWLREACAVAGRDLTEAEWDRYVPDRPWRATCTDLG